MMRRIVRTTRRTQVNNGNEEPVETMQEREVERVVREEDDARGYDENRALQPWIRGLQSVTQRQLALLREFDLRLFNSDERNRLASDERNRLASDERNRLVSNEASFERASFWMVWVVLMVVLGSALAVVVLLVLTSSVR